jgi:aspartyl-tRNA(Asn)/glutamyl-tRNA(Gln) amidotransferase subunit C
MYWVSSSFSAHPGVTVEIADIEKLAHLARLDIKADAMPDVASRIANVLRLVDQLTALDTDHVTPMAHPLDAVQRLSPDIVTEPNQRESFLAIAPASEQGLYLVPKVID